MNMLLMHGASPPLVGGDFRAGYLPPSMAFSRSSSGMRLNGAGVLESIALNEPRFDWDINGGLLLGLLYEPQRTNLVLRSWRISSWVNNNSTLTTNNIYISPDGTQNATQIITSSEYGGRYITVSGLIASTDYAVSGYVKSFSGSSIIRVGASMSEGTSGSHLHIDTITGNVVYQGAYSYDVSSVLLPSGWVYFKYRIHTGASQTSTPLVAYSMTSGATFSVWGVVLEAGSKALSLIQTDGSAVTRAADQLSIAIPKGVNTLRIVFDDKSIQDVAVTTGAYTVPTDLNRARIKQLYSL